MLAAADGGITNGLSGRAATAVSADVRLCAAARTDEASRTGWGCRRRACTAAWVRLPGPLAVGRQIGPGVARLGVGQGLLVPIRVARSWEAEHRPFPGRGPLDDLEPV